MQKTVPVLFNKTKGSGMKYPVLILALLLTVEAGLAQDDFEAWLKKDQQAFQNFLSEEDKAFSDFLKKSWKPYDPKAGEKADLKPKPIDIPRAPEPEIKPVNRQPDLPKVKELPKLPPPPAEMKPLAEPVKISPKGSPVPLYNAELMLDLNTPADFKLSRPYNNEQIGTAWKTLASLNFTPLLDQIKQNRQTRHLNDWAVFQMIKSIARKQYSTDTGKQLVFSWFLLIKSGFQAKIAYDTDQLYLLLPSQQAIFETRFVQLENIKYYIFVMDNSNPAPTRLSTYSGDYPGQLGPIDLRVSEIPLLNGSSAQRTFLFTFNGKEISVPVSFSEDMIILMKNYPQTDLNVFFSAAVSDPARYSLLKALRPLVDGKTELEAVNLLLRFIQTGFEYKTDDQQFGREKYLAPDESLFYPACDCEDRSILFSYLVKNLLGLPVIALDYPGHIAAAVKFSKPFEGDQVSFNGQTYMICDPTYINADAGMCMPNYKNIDPKIVKM